MDLHGPCCALTRDPGPGAPADEYVGVTASATVGAGGWGQCSGRRFEPNGYLTAFAGPSANWFCSHWRARSTGTLPCELKRPLAKNRAPPPAAVRVTGGPNSGRGSSIFVRGLRRNEASHRAAE